MLEGSRGLTHTWAGPPVSLPGHPPASHQRHQPQYFTLEMGFLHLVGNEAADSSPLPYPVHLHVRKVLTPLSL